MHFELTRMSSRGQIVIPEATRKVLGVRIGTKFAIFTDGKNILNYLRGDGSIVSSIATTMAYRTH